jgi:hypothetical protein
MRNRFDRFMDKAHPWVTVGAGLNALYCGLSGMVFWAAFNGIVFGILAMQWWQERQLKKLIRDLDNL